MEREELKKKYTLNKILEMLKKSTRGIGGRHSPQIITKI
jgi:hypothetical protein